MSHISRCLTVGLALLFQTSSITQTLRPIVPPKGFELSVWAREPMLKNPVALSFDNQERLYVVETARRGTVDIDIRSHKEWLIDDLSNQSISDIRQFFRNKMAPGKSAENARWLVDRNHDGSHDWKDLMEVRERVHWLEDTDGDGKADLSKVFAEGFNEEINGVIAGVLPWEQHVWVTIYPDLWRLKDNNGDGIAETKESVFRGFGVHAAFDGHDLHGLTIGPDGKLYFSVGDNGFSVVTQEGRQLHHPNTGGVLRMNPDGSQLEVFAIGLRNVQELAFDEFGNLFSVDNDGDLADERERFVYIVEGSDSGWRINWQFRERGWARITDQPDYNPWIAEGMWIPHWDGQPAYITPPLSNYSVGPSGFKYNPGTALNKAYQRHFFIVQFPVQKITAFQVQPKGAYFEMIGEHVFLSGMMASAVNFSPSGAMFIADWDGMWSPNEKGAIYVLDDPKVAGSAIRTEVKQLLQDGLQNRSMAELMGLLGHADMRIRQMSQFETVRRNGGERLLSTAQDTSAPQLARVHALWGLSQLRPQLAVDQIPFRDSDPEIRAQAAKLAGELRLNATVSMVAALLSDPSRRVQFHAAMALGKIRQASAFDPVVQLLAQNDNQDPFIRHAGVVALTGIGKVDRLESLATHESSAVRAAAVVALRRLQSPGVTRFLTDPDIWVQREAVRAIHDDFSIPEALPSLAELLDDSELPDDEAIVRRAINANLRLGKKHHAERLIQIAINPAGPEWIRIEALESLGAWNKTPYVDRVVGRVRPLRDRSPALGNDLIQRNLTRLLETAKPNLAESLTRILTDNRIQTNSDLFARWVGSPDQPVAVRVQSLRLLANRKATELAPAIKTALRADLVELRQAAIEVLADSDSDSFVKFIRNRNDDWSIPETQTALRLAALVNRTETESFILEKFEALLADKLPQELELDVIEASQSSDSQKTSVRLADYRMRLSANNPKSRYNSMLHGGNPAKGAEIFLTHVGGQCVRCHDAGGDINQVGPVLTGIGDRVTREYLLESLVEPSARVAEGFESISVSTTDGEIIEGILAANNDDSISLRLSTGEVQTIDRNQIEQQSTSTVSAMPPMTDVLTPFEIRDLVAYLVTLH